MFYYQHHIGDFNRATAGLTSVQSMAYLRLIWLYYDSERPIPDNRELLAFKLGIEQDTVRLILESFFHLTDDGWRHTRCDAEIAAYRALIHKKSTAGKASAEHLLNRRSTGVEQVLDGCSTGEQLTNNRITVNHKPLKEKSARGTRLQVEELPVEWLAFCQQERPDLNAHKSFDAFRDYWLALPGDKGVKLDWLRTWRNWVRNSRKESAVDALAGRRAKGDAALAVMTGKIRRMSDANVINMEAQNDLLRAIAGDGIQRLPVRN